MRKRRCWIAGLAIALLAAGGLCVATREGPTWTAKTTLRPVEARVSCIWFLSADQVMVGYQYEKRGLRQFRLSDGKEIRSHELSVHKILPVTKGVEPFLIDFDWKLYRLSDSGPRLIATIPAFTGACAVFQAGIAFVDEKTNVLTAQSAVLPEALVRAAKGKPVDELEAQGGNMAAILFDRSLLVGNDKVARTLVPADVGAVCFDRLPASGLYYAVKDFTKGDRTSTLFRYDIKTKLTRQVATVAGAVDDLTACRDGLFVRVQRTMRLIHTGHELLWLKEGSETQEVVAFKLGFMAYDVLDDEMHLVIGDADGSITTFARREDKLGLLPLRMSR